MHSSSILFEEVFLVCDNVASVKNGPQHAQRRRYLMRDGIALVVRERVVLLYPSYLLRVDVGDTLFEEIRLSF
jgi:hypothetical protein